MNYTQGQWEAQVANGTSGQPLFYVVAIGDHSFINCHPNPHIGVDIEQAKANAHLLSAAKDLLQAAQEATYGVLDPETRKKLETAINKALGKEPATSGMTTGSICK